MRGTCTYVPRLVMVGQPFAVSPALRYVLAGGNTKLGGSGPRMRMPETSGMAFMD